jgi:hypothetical protein
MQATTCKEYALGAYSSTGDGGWGYVIRDNSGETIRGSRFGCLVGNYSNYSSQVAKV